MKVLEFKDFEDLVESNDLKSDGLIKTLIVLVSVHGVDKVSDIFDKMQERMNATSG